MYLFHRIYTNWLPRVSLLLLISVLWISLADISHSVFLIFVPAVFFITILSGLFSVLKNTPVDLILFYRRPANTATLARSLLVITALLCGAIWFRGGHPFLRVFSLILIVSGYTADFLDGWLARREKQMLPAAEWGGWYDAETDALLLLLSSLFLIRYTRTPHLLLLPGICRYGFGLLFSFFPSDYKSPRWYFWYSKTSAAVFEILIALLWCTHLLADSSAFLSRFLMIQKTLFIPATSLLILFSFLIESFYRMKAVLSRIPRGYRRGIFLSFLVYYRIPFRRRKMKKFYSSFIHPDDLTFDAGAHLGNRTRIFLELGARVVAVEPQPACRGLLELWFGAHKKAHLCFAALGAAEKDVEMLLSRRNPTLASTDPAWVRELHDQPPSGE